MAIDPEEEDLPDNSEAGVLSPEELGPSEDHAVEIEEGRFVVSSCGKPDVNKQVGEQGPRPEQTEGKPDRSQEGIGGSRHPGLQDSSDERTESSFDEDPLPSGRYSYKMVLSIGDEKVELEKGTDNVEECFKSLMDAYTDQLSDDTPNEEILGVLLASAAHVNYPPSALKEVLQDMGMNPSDSLADLMKEVYESGGLEFETSKK